MQLTFPESWYTKLAITESQWHVIKILRVGHIYKTYPESQWHLSNIPRGLLCRHSQRVSDSFITFPESLWHFSNTLRYFFSLSVTSNLLPQTRSIELAFTESQWQSWRIRQPVIGWKKSDSSVREDWLLKKKKGGGEWGCLFTAPAVKMTALSEAEADCHITNK